MNHVVFANKSKARKLAVVALLTITIIALTFSLCSCGKSGEDGRDATVSISENGEIVVNGEPTGVVANKADCEVSVSVEGNAYGKAVGGGKFAKGKTVAVSAIPFDGACFLGWKNQSGDIVSIDETYVFVAEKEKTELTAVFEKSVIEVYFKTSTNLKQYFGGNIVLLINGEKQEFEEKIVASNKTYVLKSPATFDYGDTVTFELPNFQKPSYKYEAFLYSMTENEYNGTGAGSRTKLNDDSFEYSFKITENKKYFFRFDIEVNISIGIVPSVEVSANDSSLGSVQKTECKNLGDEVTLTAQPKYSGTSDFVYEFNGWYLDGDLVSKNPTYTFTVNEYHYDFTAKFVIKYALKISISKSDKEVYDEKIDPTAYTVTVKKVTVNAIDKNGNIYSATFSGNYGGATLDDSTKICGYFEKDETILLSVDIESAHETCYFIKGQPGNEYKYYAEKFVYARWKIKKDSSDLTNFGSGTSATYTFGNNLSTHVDVELYVLHNGDKIRG